MDRARHERLYRVIAAADWEAAQRAGVVVYGDHDRRDGFLHLSTRAQVLATAQRYFAGRRDLLALELDAPALGETVKFEASRNGELFPHLYGELAIGAVIRAWPLAPRGEAFAFADEEGE